MVAFESLQAQCANTSQAEFTYEVMHPLNLYDSSTLQSLATQAQAGRKLRFNLTTVLEKNTPQSVVLCEDHYPGWIAPSALEFLQPTDLAYCPVRLSLAQIQAKIPLAIAFAQSAMTQPNVYLWGGTLGPDYDCSGLIQHAFSAQGIWLPRDAYQQEAFVQWIESGSDRETPSICPDHLVECLQLGDLVFFGTPIKATHVGLYLGNGAYIHSSGKDQGRNGIGIDSLIDLSEQVSRNYRAQIRGAGRIVNSYQPR
jgi:hypothetical protein